MFNIANKMVYMVIVLFQLNNEIYVNEMNSNEMDSVKNIGKMCRIIFDNIGKLNRDNCWTLYLYYLTHPGLDMNKFDKFTKYLIKSKIEYFLS